MLFYTQLNVRRTPCVCECLCMAQQPGVGSNVLNWSKCWLANVVETLLGSRVVQISGPVGLILVMFADPLVWGTSPGQAAPSKEAASHRAYRIKSRLNSLRRAACKIFNAPHFSDIIRRVEEEVDTSRIRMRTDRCVWKDLGMMPSEWCATILVCTSLQQCFVLSRQPRQIAETSDELWQALAQDQFGGCVRGDRPMLPRWASVDLHSGIFPSAPTLNQTS